MELKNKEFVDLSKYSIDKRKRMFPSRHFGEALYCIVFRNPHGCFTLQYDSIQVYEHSLNDLKDNDYKEIRVGCNNLGRM